MEHTMLASNCPAELKSLVFHFQKEILKKIFLLAIIQKGYSTHFYPIGVALFH